jgi:Zn-dependent peptidase ImmA (M78 family)
MVSPRLEVREAQAVLEAAGVQRPPVPVESIARQLGARLSYEPFDGNVSGLLYRDGDQVVIGVNTLHPEVRQRFTVAHELGHWKLHPGKRVFLDHLVRVDLRDGLSAEATDRQEIQANGFAAELLMPRDMIVREVAHHGLARSPIGVDQLVEELAAVFQVSRQAMEYRLVNLGIRGHL